MTTIDFTTEEVIALKAMVEDLEEPDKTLVDLDWSDDRIDRVIAGLTKKLGLRLVR